jgi:hypothetical protein
MQQKLIDLSTQYVQAGGAILDAIRDIIKDAGGFINASNNKLEKSDMKALVFDSKTGYSETFPIRGLRVNEKDEVEVFVGIFGTIYTDKYLRGKASDERWRLLKGSNILFYQSILSIIRNIDEYLGDEPSSH